MTATETITWGAPCEFAGPNSELTIMTWPEGTLIHHEESDLWLDTDGRWIPWSLVTKVEDVYWADRNAAITTAITTL